MSNNINKLLKQAQCLQSQMMQAQEELTKKTFEGTAGGNMVKVTMNGGGDCTAVSINPEVVDPDDVEMLEDLIMAAFKNAQEKVKEQSNAAMGGLTSGMDLGGLGFPK
jgi:DNA-binding YbaB/EbfC family protein